MCLGGIPIVSTHSHCNLFGHRTSNCLPSRVPPTPTSPLPCLRPHEPIARRQARPCQALLGSAPSGSPGKIALTSFSLRTRPAQPAHANVRSQTHRECAARQQMRETLVALAHLPLLLPLEGLPGWLLRQGWPPLCRQMARRSPPPCLGLDDSLAPCSPSKLPPPRRAYLL
jgi:hypothetical protein